MLMLVVDRGGGVLMGGEYSGSCSQKRSDADCWKRR